MYSCPTVSTDRFRAGILAMTLLAVCTFPIVGHARDFEQAEEYETSLLAKQLLTCDPLELQACEDAFGEACIERNGGWTTYSSVLCESARHTYWMDRHEAVFPGILDAAAHQSDAERDAVEARFEAWERYRDRRCGRYDAMDGTMWRGAATSCRADMARFLAQDSEMDALILGVEGAIQDEWHWDGAIENDLDCDGIPETLVPGAVSTPQGEFATVGREGEHGLMVRVIVLPVDSKLQEAVCGLPITLSPEPATGSRCEGLRIDDESCDSVTVYRLSRGKDLVLQRN